MNKKNSKVWKLAGLLFVFVLLASPAFQLQAQDTEFWFAAPDDSYVNNACDRPTFLVITTSVEPANVTISIGGVVRRTVYIPAYHYHKEDFTTTTDLNLIENSIATGTAGTVQTKGIHIASDNPVSAYYQVNGACSKDVFTLKGEKALGTSFLVPFQTRYGTPYATNVTDAYNHFVIVATEDNTSVTVKAGNGQSLSSNPNTSPGSTIYRPAGNITSGNSFTITLNEGQTYTVRELNRRRNDQYGWAMASATLAGTEVTSDKPIAITVAEPATAFGTSSDLLGDQLVPIAGAATNYLVITGFGDVEYTGGAEEWIYVMATEDNTVVDANYEVSASVPHATVTLQKGQHWTYKVQSGTPKMTGIHFSADKPILCYHQSAYKQEVGAAVMPNMYSIAAKSLSFFKQTTGVTGTDLFLIFRKGAHDAFTINGNALSISGSEVIEIPEIDDWVYVKKDISSIPEGYCIVENPNSAFAMGVFTYRDGESTAYGFLSSFGPFSFAVDTVYKCEGGSTLLDAGYAKGYAWVFPDGTTATTSTISTTQEGWHKVTVDHDNIHVMDSLYVKDRFKEVKIKGARVVNPGETYTYYVDLGNDYSANVLYTWHTDNGAVSSATSDTIEVVWTSDGVLTVEIEDEALGCTKVLQLGVALFPDNIVDDMDCYVDPPGTPFSFAKLAESPGAYTINNYSIPLVGDIDNDGITEIIVPGSYASEAGEVSTDKLYIFKFSNNQLVHQQTLSTPSFHNVVNAYSMAKVDGNDYAAIFLCTDGSVNTVAADKRQLIKYVYNEATKLYEEYPVRGTYSDVDTKEMAQPMLVDFNGDGIPEVVTYDKVFNARTMQLLVDGNLLSDNTMGFGFGGHPNNYQGTTETSALMAIADVDGDGVPEVIGGNTVYKVHITNPGSSSGNTFEVWSQCDRIGPGGETHNEAYDGATAVADMDGDGLLDVIVTVTNRRNASNSSYGALYIWNPRTGKVMHTNAVNTIPVHNSPHAGGPSVAFIGDIDNDKQPEICFTGKRAMYAYEYDPEAQTLTLKWDRTTSDYSGATTMVMFDFNQDGMQELVYRDETQLRIIRGTDGSDMITPVSCTSATANEYPVIADVNNDGAAEIIVTGDSMVWVYASNPVGTWAPARKIWNQFAYNVVNINSDLSVPFCQMDPATVFPGADGMLGTVDDVRPYNAYLQQQTMLNKNGVSLWLTPEGRVTGNHAFYYDAGMDSMMVTIEVCNRGDASFKSPFYVTAYRNSVGGSPKYTYTYHNNINPDDTASITFGIPNFIQDWGPFDRIVIQINDNGDGTNDQAVCDDTNRLLEAIRIIASDDRKFVFEDITDQEINVLRNDLVPSDCTNPTVEVLSSPSYKGSATVRDGRILYTPASDAVTSDADTLRYRVYCDDESKADTATVYIRVVEKPDNIVDADCYIIPPATEWEITLLKQSPVNYFAFGSPVLAGDLDGDGRVEIVINDGTPDKGTRLAILDDDLQVKYTLTSSESFVNTTSTFAMANVDDGSSAAIFIATSATRQLKKFTLNTSMQRYEQAWSVSYSANSNYDMGNPLIVDFNGDGFAEVSVYDKIFDARDGTLLVDGGLLGAYTVATNPNSFGLGGGHPVTSVGARHGSLMATGDIDGDGLPELIGGDCVYKVVINSRTTPSQNAFTLLRKADHTGHAEVGDGPTSLADMDLDGQLDVVVTRNISTSYHGVYIWNPRTGEIMHTNVVNDLVVSNPNYFGPSMAALGNLDDDPYPEIAFIGFDYMYVYDFDPSTKLLTQKWNMYVNDESAITLFDFNQDNRLEMVYRDFTKLMILNGDTKQILTSIPCGSGTANEYPLILDVNNDGHAEFVIVAGGNNAATGTVRIYGSEKWASARKVWNQYAYNAVHVNEDLTIPKFQLNPATVFPGADGLLGTADDVRPYNNFLQQQTMLNKNGTPLWLAPDIYPDPTLINTTITGDSACITVGVINEGDAAIGPPVYVALYKEAVSPANFLMYDSIDTQILPGDTGYVNIRIPDITLLPLIFEMVIRVNDNGVQFMYEEECDDTDNVLILRNPIIRRLMKKEATLLLEAPHTPIQDNGTYPNPVSVLHSEKIEYKITAINVYPTASPVVILDTLPPYLKYETGTAVPSTVSVSTAGTTPPRAILEWTLSNVAAGADTTVRFEATPESGACASQPMFINSAWITLKDTFTVATGNSTYHQGAGISLVSFSTGLGGTLYQAEPQAVDYNTPARSGVLIVPDEGYRFSGWSHDDYVSLRGEPVAAASGILLYDTLTIYGNVTLQAHFELEEYEVSYHLNGADNGAGNPSSYTIASGAMELQAPTKANDVFVGWTGSNGDTPQASVVIPGGTTGALEYYANFLHSGREEEELTEETVGDRIWSARGALYIRSSKTGGIVRIYSTEGVLQKVHAITAAGETKLKLPRGLYIVTLNNNIGQKVMIE